MSQNYLELDLNRPQNGSEYGSTVIGVLRYSATRPLRRKVGCGNGDRLAHYRGTSYPRQETSAVLRFRRQPSKAFHYRV